MASIKTLRSGGFQLCVKNKLLPKPLWATFDTYDQAKHYGDQLERLLGQGIVPAALLEHELPKRTAWTIGRCIVEYVRNNPVPVSDVKVLDAIRPDFELVSTGNLNYDWADGWIRSMKRVANLAPSTIRHRHGALARCFDWMLRKHPDIMAQNPLRLLKRGFSTYTEEDEEVLARSGKKPKYDVERDRRLDPDEEADILEILEGDERTFFILALETAMRMRECYTLDVTQVNIEKRTIYLRRSKNGENRQVPLSTVVCALLAEHMSTQSKAINAREGRLFPFWNGDTSVRELDRTSTDLSRVFGDSFRRAGVEGFHFHDLRHEATCRLYERTKLSDVQIAKITGHRDIRMLRRYASLRGSDLAEHLW
ncbi:site-specific integrase [Massilia sp.]|uniref:site-specific integrase n=1 Tax=Massilia sp. TaxID=1882437 RepID=UPI00352DF3CF